MSYEILGEEVRLLAPLGAADLHDDVPAGVAVLREEEEPKLVLQLFQAGEGGLQLFGGELALGAAGLRLHLAGGGDVVGGVPQRPHRLDDDLELLATAGEVAKGVRIPAEVGVGEALQYVVVLRLELWEPFEHVRTLPTCAEEAGWAPAQPFLPLRRP